MASSAHCSRSPTPSASWHDEGSSTVRWQPATPAWRILASGATADAPIRASPRLPRSDAAFVPRIPRYDQYDTSRNASASPLRCSSHRRRDHVQPRRAVREVRCRRATKSSSRRRSFSTGGADGRSTTSTRSTRAIDANGTLVYGVFNDVDVRSEARSRRARPRIHAGHPRRQAHVQRCLQHARSGGLRRGEPRQPGADDAAVRCAQYRRLRYDYRDEQPPAAHQLRHDGCHQLRQPGRSRRFACVRRARSTAIQTAALDFEWAAIGCLHAEVRSAVEELHLQVAPKRAAPTERPRNLEARSPVRSASTDRELQLPHSASATASNMPAGSATDWLMPDLIAARRRTGSQQSDAVSAWASSLRSATTTRSKKTTWRLRPGRFQLRARRAHAARQRRRALRRRRT